jgi:hypothetical protein
VGIVREDSDTPGRTIDLGDAFAQTQADRSREADEFYAALRLEGTNDEEAMLVRQALARISWSPQFYNYDVPAGFPGFRRGALSPASRNSGRRHLSNHHIVAMPDKWEYPYVTNAVKHFKFEPRGKRRLHTNVRTLGRSRHPGVGYSRRSRR